MTARNTIRLFMVSGLPLCPVRKATGGPGRRAPRRIDRCVVESASYRRLARRTRCRNRSTVVGSLRMDRQLADASSSTCGKVDSHEATKTRRHKTGRQEDRKTRNDLRGSHEDTKTRNNRRVSHEGTKTRRRETICGVATKAGRHEEPKGAVECD